MSKLVTVPNQEPGVTLFQRHVVPLPRCCPVSGNPQPGSEVRISYRAGARLLEVYHLEAFVHSFVGGHEDGTREMEAMLQRIALACARALGQRVWLRYRVVLQSGALEGVAVAVPD